MDIKSIKSKINFGNPTVAGIAISVAVFLVITGAYYYFIYSGLRIKASQKETAFNQIKMKYNSYLNLIKSYPMLLKQDRKLNKEFAALLLELPSKKNIPQLLMKISDYERTLNLNLKMFKPEKGAAKGFYETVPFSMNISGDFHNVYKFFYKLAVMKRIVNVHNVSISRSKGKGVSVGFEGTAFSFIGTPPVKRLNKAKPVKAAQIKGGAVKR